MNTDNRGFTLIEFVIALAILLIGMMALLDTVNLGLRTNYENQLRQEALLVADDEMNKLRNNTYAHVASGETTGFVPKKVYNGYTNYSVVTKVIPFGKLSSSKSLDVEVRWRHKGKVYNHTISSMISKSID